METLEEQAVMVERHGLVSLLFCDDPWALRHQFINTETGEVIRARCNRWDCGYCGPRKVDMWRQLVKEAEPTLFVTLTKVGWTIQEASRVYTTVLQYLRRGSKGRSRDGDGARPAYPVECFSVLEEHSNFERVGFHWHILMKGVDYLPHDVVREALRSATKGRSYVVRIRAVKNARSVGYVTKYLTKDVAIGRRGVRMVKRERMMYQKDEQGQVRRVPVVREVEEVSRARRIRYTRGFFPESTKVLRARLFSDLGNGELSLDSDVGPDVGDEVEQEAAGSSWMLREVAPPSDDLGEHVKRRQEALMDSLADLREGKRLYSSRVVSIWDYQRRRMASRKGLK